MLKKLLIVLYSVFFLAFSANAGSDNELKLEKNSKQVKECFENLNKIGRASCRERV